MVDLPDGEISLKICLLASTEYTNVTDRQTGRHHAIAQAAHINLRSIARQKCRKMQRIIYYYVVSFVSWRHAQVCVVYKLRRIPATAKNHVIVTYSDNRQVALYASSSMSAQFGTRFIHVRQGRGALRVIGDFLAQRSWVRSDLD